MSKELTPLQALDDLRQVQGWTKDELNKRLDIIAKALPTNNNVAHINDVVYIIGPFNDSITKTKVTMLGETSFAHEYSFDDGFVEEFRQPCEYDDKGSRWFTSLVKAKTYLHKLHKNCKIKQRYDDYWSVEL